MRVSRNSDEIVSSSDLAKDCAKTIVLVIVSISVFNRFGTTIANIAWYYQLLMYVGLITAYFQAYLVISCWKEVVSREASVVRLIIEGAKGGLPTGLVLGGLILVGVKWPVWTVLGIGIVVVAVIIWALLSNRADERAKTRITDGDTSAE